MIIPSISKSGGKSRAKPGASAYASGSSTSIRVEPVRRTTQQTERRSSETLANANALRLGIAAQMLASHEALQAANVLPTHPSMRMAARYATTSEGAAPLGSLGFSRSV